MRTAGDDKFMPLYTGGTDFPFLDMDNLQEKVKIKSFVPNDLLPFIFIGNKKGTRTWAMSKKKEGNEKVMLYYQEDATPQIYIKNISNIPKISEADWRCGTTNFDQKYLYLGGEFKGKGVAGVIRFSKSFKFAGYSEYNLPPITTISRIKGTDIVIYGGNNFLSIMSFDKKNARVMEIHQYLDLKSGIIEDALFLSNRIFFLGKDSGLGVIEYEQMVDQTE